ncbi:hypothetical protein ACVXHB_18155 [Escherichia coli]
MEAIWQIEVEDLRLSLWMIRK